MIIVLVSPERLSVLSNVYPCYGDLVQVLIKVENRDHGISFWGLGMSRS